jgi:plasmid stability protein
MSQVLVRGLAPQTIGKLRLRAKQSGRSLEAELRLILQEATEHVAPTPAAALSQIRQLFAGQTFSDSAELIRADRER